MADDVKLSVGVLALAVAIFCTIVLAQERPNTEPANKTAATSPALGRYLAALAEQKQKHESDCKSGTAVRYGYVVILPKDYEKDAQKKWPLILYLHGSRPAYKDEPLPFEAKVWDHGTVAKMSKGSVNEEEAKGISGMRDDVIVVAPLGLGKVGGAYWRWPSLNDLLEEVAQKHRIDSDRVYLTGFSMGAAGTWNTALAMPDRFAAIAPVAGRTGLTDSGILTLGDEYAKENAGKVPPTPPYAADLLARIRHVPVWAFSGMEDKTCPVETTRWLVDVFKAAGGNIDFTIVPGANHPGTRNHVYKMPEFYEWLLKHKRQTGPQSAPATRSKEQ